MSNAIVIIPTYNERDNIAAIIEAVFAQPKDFDILIVDDGSPDGTGTATGSQCWDTGFKTVFNALAATGTTSTDFSANEGKESDCGFAAAEYYSGN